jgi:hypothetical protein
MKRAFGVFSFAAAISLATVAFAQQRPGISLDKRWPGDSLEQRETEPPEEEAAPETAPAKKPAAQIRSGAKAQTAPPAPPHVIKCSGAFAKDSSEVRLAALFGKDSISWTQVAGPEGSKLNASVLYPNDPKRRLEVLWNVEDSRSGTQVIDINGQSTWIAPMGLKLGMPMAAIEKLNKKPFSLKSFGGENGGQVTSWNGGALTALPGGCKVSIRFAPDPKAAAQTKTDLQSDKEILSNLAALKIASPKVTEIIIGY